MKRAILFALATGFLFGAEIRIDHVTVCGTSLDDLRKAFALDTGVQPEYGGPHSNHATEMALVSFPDGSYIEFMGFQAQADPAAAQAHYWGKFLRANAGPCAFAIRVPDVAAEVARLKSAHVEVGGAEHSGRTRPDGTKLDWESAAVGAGPRGSFFPFLIRDFTPRESRVYPAGKPTTSRFGGVAKIVIAVGDLDGAIAKYRQAFGLTAPRTETNTEFQAKLAWFEGTPVVLAQGEEGSWVARRVRQYGDVPCGIVLKGGAGGVAGSAYRMFGRNTISVGDVSRPGWKLGIEVPAKLP